MSKFGSQLVPPSQVRVTVGPIARPVGAMRFVSIVEFEKLFTCSVNSLPQNVCLLGWKRDAQSWFCAPASFAIARPTHASHLFHGRSIETLLRFLSTGIFPELGASTIWFAFCFYDAWRERNVFSSSYRWVTPPDLTDWMEWYGEPGEVPILSTSQPWVACFGAHNGDPSAFLLPDAHYLTRNSYAEMFADVDRWRTPWKDKQKRAVFAAGDHGESRNLFVPPKDRSVYPRRVFARVVESERLNADVFLGKIFSPQQQSQYRLIADVDGFARTWDAWAWKMMSGSTVLAVESPWVSFFSEQFLPWLHYIPVANDCSDLAAKLRWCENNDEACEAIARRARTRAQAVYARTTVVARVLARLRKKLAEPLSEPGFNSLST